MFSDGAGRGRVSDNVIIGNTLTHNGLGGVALHTHVGTVFGLPADDMSGNKIVGNTIAGNLAEQTFYTATPGRAGININSGDGGSPVRGTVISQNVISDEDIDIAVNTPADSHPFELSARGWHRGWGCLCARRFVGVHWHNRCDRELLGMSRGSGLARMRDHQCPEDFLDSLVHSLLTTINAFGSAAIFPTFEAAPLLQRSFRSCRELRLNSRKTQYRRNLALLAKNRLSDNVGGVKQFSTTLPHALEEERHFALVDSLPFQP